MNGAKSRNKGGNREEPLSMVFWSLADTLAVASIIFDAWGILIGYTLTRLTGGAPKAWYVIIAGFGVLAFKTLTQLYLHIQSPDNRISDMETAISLAVGILFAVGTFMLLRTFQRQLKAANLVSPQT